MFLQHHSEITLHIYILTIPKHCIVICKIAILLQCSCKILCRQILKASLAIQRRYFHYAIAIHSYLRIRRVASRVDVAIVSILMTATFITRSREEACLIASRSSIQPSRDIANRRAVGNKRREMLCQNRDETTNRIRIILREISRSDGTGSSPGNKISRIWRAPARSCCTPAS